MPAKTCYKTFSEATEERAKYPLKSGGYKLQNALRGIHDLNDTLISHGHCSGSLCLPNEFKRWTKRVPHALADSIGWELIPGV